MAHPRLPAPGLEPRLRYQLAVARDRGDLLAVATLETALAAFGCPCWCHTVARCPGSCAMCNPNHRRAVA